MPLRVSPEPLEPVKRATVAAEDVHDEVEVVEQDPFGFLDAFRQCGALGQVPLDAPVWVVHARDDDTVPFSQAEAYVDASTAAGAEATLVEVTGGHFGVIETGSDAWAACVEVLDAIAD